MSAWLSFGVALAALLQTWLLSLWRRLYRRGTIDIVQRGRIEIGFSTWGPTLVLLGTLAAVHHDQFVRSMTILVTRARDGATHSFRWEAFRVGPDQFELPRAFLVRTAEPYPYCIVFVDGETRAEVDAILAGVRTEWANVLHAHPAASDQAASAELYATFMRTRAHVQAHTDLGRALYWNPGDYAVELTVHTSRPTADHSRTWSFTLTENDLALLRLNAIPVLSETCGQSAAYNFAYAEYQPASSVR